MAELIEISIVLLKLLLIGLASYRYAILLYEENGPWDMLAWIRMKAGVFHSIQTGWNGTVMIQQETREGEKFFAKLLNCPHCLSAWFVLIFIAGSLALGNPIFNWLVYIGAAWAVARICIVKE